MTGGARFRTMTARYPGTCLRCRQPIAVGDPIRYGGRGLVYHVGDTCPAGRRFDVDPDEQPTTLRPGIDAGPDW